MSTPDNTQPATQATVEAEKHLVQTSTPGEQAPLVDTSVPEDASTDHTECPVCQYRFVPGAPRL